MLRALLAVIAVVACAWFVLGLRQAHDVNEATNLLSGSSHIDRRDGVRVASLLHSAQLLNPDRQVEMLRAQLADERGDRTRAEAILRRVVAAEPLNALAWVQLARSATNGQTLRLAFRHLEQLVPPVGAAKG